MDSDNQGQISLLGDGTIEGLNIRKIPCPRGCPWYRKYTRTPQWLNSIVDHPLYGPITEMDLVQREMKEHDCNETHNAKVRLRRRRDGRKNPRTGNNGPGD